MKRIKHIFTTHSGQLILCLFLICSRAEGIFAQASEQYVKRDTLVKHNVIKNGKKQINFNGEDGPYIVNDTLYRVTSDNRLISKPHVRLDSLLVRVDNDYGDKFLVALQSEYNISPSTYPSSDKVVVLSDIEGNYNAFAGFLYANNIIDKEHNWNYDQGKVVLLGDFVDRGKNVTQVLWLIYKLEQQALKKGGRIHFLLGNHEVFNFQGHHTYNRGKYIKAAQEISGEKNAKEAIKYLYSENTEIGRWLATKNVIEKIGDYLFVHAGLSPEILQYKLNLESINSSIRAQLSENKKQLDTTTQFLLSSKGPLWYRGLVTSKSKYSKIGQEELDKILDYYAAKKIVIGHTIVQMISSDYDGKVIRLDVPHSKKKFSGRTFGLLIENNREFVIDDKGKRIALREKL